MAELEQAIQVGDGNLVTSMEYLEEDNAARRSSPGDLRTARE